MPIDTTAKRWALLGFGFWGEPSLPDGAADNELDVVDRSTLLGLSGFVIGAPVVPEDFAHTFEGELESGDLHLGFYVKIGGLPFIFADFDKPAGWDIGVMTWSRSFIPFRLDGANLSSSLKAVGEEADWASGVSVTGSLDLEFKVDQEDPDDVWTNLVVPKNRHTWHLDGSVVHKPSSTVWKLVSYLSLQGGTLSAADLVYCGIGTARVESVFGGAIYVDPHPLPLAPSYHEWRGPVGRMQGSPRGGDIEVTNFPEVWERRPIEVYLVLCDRDRVGWRVPKATQIDEAPFCQQIFAGEAVTFPVWSAESPVVTVLTSSLGQPLENALVSRSQVYNLGPSRRGMGAVLVERSGPCVVEWETVPLDIAATYTQSGEINLIDYLIEIGVEIPGSGLLMTASSVAGNICAALGYQAYFGTRQIVWNWNVVTEETGGGEEVPVGTETVEQKIQIKAAVLDAGNFSPPPYNIRLKVNSANDRARNLLYALGATEDLILKGESSSERLQRIAEDPSPAWATVICQDPIPHYYVGPSQRHFIWSGDTVVDLETDTPPYQQGTTDVSGRPNSLFVRIGEHEIAEVKLRGPGGTTMVRFQDSSVENEYLGEFIRRGRMSVPKPITIPAKEIDDAKHKLFVGLLFEDNDLFDAVRQLLVSNGDPLTGGMWDDAANRWNVLPQGFGARFPAKYLDSDSFEVVRLGTLVPKAYGLWVEGSLTAREFLGEVALGTGVNFLTRRVGNQLKFAAIPMEPPVGARAVLTIDDSWVDDMRRPVKPDYDELGIRNRLSFEYDYDPVEQKFMGKDNRFVDGNSIAKHGMSDPIDFRIRWLTSLGDVVPQLTGIAAAFFRRFAEPLVGYALSSAKPGVWRLSAGDIVLFTRSREPNFRDGWIGLTDVEMRVEKLDNNYGPDDTFGDVRITWHVSRTGRPWGPSAAIESFQGADTYRVYANTNIRAFSIPESGFEDVDEFKVGDVVQAYVPGVDDVEGPFAILGIDGQDIQLDGTITLDLNDGVVLEYANYALEGVSETQKDHVALADEQRTVKDFENVRRDGSKWL